uniref:Transposase n=1 Tax=Heterorhabditis bacteriophora TaxID=37862 RepID=A0A1I7WUA0_HETBA
MDAMQMCLTPNTISRESHWLTRKEIVHNERRLRHGDDAIGSTGLLAAN